MDYFNNSNKAIRDEINNEHNNENNAHRHHHHRHHRHHNNNNVGFQREFNQNAGEEFDPNVVDEEFEREFAQMMMEGQPFLQNPR